MRGGEFLQSHAWEDLQKSVGRKTWRVENILVIQHIMNPVTTGVSPWYALRRFADDTPSPLWDRAHGFRGNGMKAGMNYLYCPRPEFSDANHLNIFLEKIVECAEREQSIFLKIDCSSDISLSRTSYKIISSQSLQPQSTSMLDVSLPQEKLLAAMHEKTRYNIHLAEKKGVTVSRAVGDARDADMFFSLLQETAARDRFRTHQKKYYQELLKASSNDFSNELFCARYQGELLACALVNFYAPANTVTYLHGASSRVFRNVMAPYLLHWSMIQEAKKRNFQYYDFWGVDEDRWHGVTRFKKGFRGTLVEYPASHDIVFRPFWYRMYHYAKRVI